MAWARVLLEHSVSLQIPLSNLLTFGFIHAACNGFQIPSSLCWKAALEHDDSSSVLDHGNGVTWVMGCRHNPLALGQMLLLCSQKLSDFLTQFFPEVASFVPFSQRLDLRRADDIVEGCAIDSRAARHLNMDHSSVRRCLKATGKILKVGRSTFTFREKYRSTASHLHYRCITALLRATPSWRNRQRYSDRDRTVLVPHALQGEVKINRLRCNLCLISIFLPFDRLSVDKCSISHHFHPTLHFFGCVSAKVVRPHVWVCGLLKGRRDKQNGLEEEKTKRKKLNRKPSWTEVFQQSSDLYITASYRHWFYYNCPVALV